MNQLKITLFVILLSLSFALKAQDGTVKSFTKIKKGDSGLSGIDFTYMRYFGKAATNIGDIDRDGVIDIAVSGYNKNTGKGSIYILFLKKDGSVKSNIEISNGKGGLPNNFTTASLEGFGVSIASIGDFDKDGVKDIAVGNYGISNSFQGEIYLFLLNTNGTVKNYNIIGEDNNGFNGNLKSGDSFGCSIANIDDIDKNGVIDLAVGAYGDSESGIKGAFWILLLNADRTVKSFKKSGASLPLLSSLQLNDAFGYAITSIGYIDNDSIVDIAVSAPFSDEGGINRGSVRILNLNSDGSIKSLSKISQLTGNFDTIPNNTTLGTELGSLGDLDGDSILDFVIGAANYNTSRGAIWNIFLKKDGTCKSFQRITSNTGGFNKTLNPTDEFGGGLDFLGDLNGDGITDLVTSAILDDEGGKDIGAIYILFLNGKPQFITPVASFTQSKDTIKINECVNFSDNSTNIPTSWKWTFQGGNPSSSTLQNPSNICFSAAGKYTMTLIATNSKGSDTATKTIVVKAPVGVEAVYYSLVKISPNPFSNSTTIQTDKFLNNANLAVYNTQGQVVSQIKNISGREISYQRGNLPSGLYFINLSQDSEFFTTGKLIITD